MIAARAPVRIVFAGSFRYGATELAIANGLRRLGWLVEQVDNSRYYDTRTLAERVELRLRGKLNIARYNREIVDRCRKVEPDVMLTVKGATIVRSTLEQLRQRNIVTINYFPDVSLDHIPAGAVAAYDRIITTKNYQLEHLRALIGAERVHFVHHGYSPEAHRPVGGSGDETQSTDILYVGTASPYKARFLAPLIKAFPDRRIRILGDGWTKLARGTPLMRAVIGGSVSPDFMADEISRARVTVALHMGKTISNDWEDLVSTRSFEIPACGGFMLHVDNPEIRSLFEVPGEIDVFASSDELIAKSRYYLAHPEEREAIAARGHARAVPAYSYSARATEIADIITARLAADFGDQALVAARARSARGLP